MTAVNILVTLPVLKGVHTSIGVLCSILLKPTAPIHSGDWSVFTPITEPGALECDA